MGTGGVAGGWAGTGWAGTELVGTGWVGTDVAGTGLGGTNEGGGGEALVWPCGVSRDTDWCGVSSSNSTGNPS